ncbi:MAG: DUF2501 domain-containing protein, partial [Acetobacteraceae bacterium]
MRALPPALPVVASLLLGFAAPAARAQLLNQLQSAAPSVSLPSAGPSASGALGALGGGVPSVASASPDNLAGVLQYCIQNNDVTDSAASSVQGQLLSKLGGGASADPGYGAGAGGTLQT